MGFGVVSELLSDISFNQNNSPMQISWIPRGQIIKNERNGYQASDIEDLAEDIKKSGLAQPLEVLALEDGRYRLLTGERRLTAIDRLAASGVWKSEIPCIVRELEDYDLPLSDEAKEMYAIIRTNRFTRKMSDADLMFETQEWTNIIRELKKTGCKELTVGTDLAGKEVKVSLHGRTREAVAKAAGVSNGQLAKMEYIKKNGIDAVQEAIKGGRLKIAAAFTLASMPKEQQEEFLQMHSEGNIRSEDVMDYQSQKTTAEHGDIRQSEDTVPADTSPEENMEMYISDILTENVEINLASIEQTLENIRRSEDVDQIIKRITQAVVEDYTGKSGSEIRLFALSYAYVIFKSVIIHSPKKTYSATEVFTLLQALDCMSERVYEA